jgi:hypothetical protein
LLNNIYVRIAIIIVLVILLYYLVVTLARSTAEANNAQRPVGETQSLNYAAPPRGAPSELG